MVIYVPKKIEVTHEYLGRAMQVSTQVGIMEDVKYQL